MNIPQKFHQVLRKIQLGLVVMLSYKQYTTNGVHNETRRIHREQKCPFCGTDNTGCCFGPERWYGDCKLFGLIETSIECERLKCGHCQAVWGRQYYFPDNRPWQLIEPCPK